MGWSWDSDKKIPGTEMELIQEMERTIGKWSLNECPMGIYRLYMDSSSGKQPDNYGGSTWENYVI